MGAMEIVGYIRESWSMVYRASNGACEHHGILDVQGTAGDAPRRPPSEGSMLMGSDPYFKNADDRKVAALEQRILELESANAVEREKIRDEALVEAAKARCIYCRLEDWSDAELHRPPGGLSYYIHRRKGQEKYYHAACNSGPIHRLRRPQ